MDAGTPPAGAAGSRACSARDAPVRATSQLLWRTNDQKVDARAQGGCSGSGRRSVTQVLGAGPHSLRPPPLARATASRTAGCKGGAARHRV
jgi:hypothetical protein